MTGKVISRERAIRSMALPKNKYGQVAANPSATNISSAMQYGRIGNEGHAKSALKPNHARCTTT